MVSREGTHGQCTITLALRGGYAKLRLSDAVTWLSLADRRLGPMTPPFIGPLRILELPEQIRAAAPPSPRRATTMGVEATSFELRVPRQPEPPTQGLERRKQRRAWRRVEMRPRCVWGLLPARRTGVGFFVFPRTCRHKLPCTDGIWAD